MSFDLSKQKLGDYRLQKRIATGSSATIYRAVDESMSRPAAVKVLSSDVFREDLTLVVRFEREARAVARLNHPHIVPVYQFSRQDDHYFLAMRYLPSDFDQLLKLYASRDRTIPVARALHILQQVASAIDFAHEHDIIHRDIKPSNILLDETDTSYLSDFGLVLWNSQDRTLGTAFGTPRYIAPEQARDGERAVPESDIYSLAVIVYEILTNRRLFQGKTPMEIALAHIEATPPSAREHNPDIPESVDRLLLEALSKEPGERPRLAVPFIEAIRGAYHDLTYDPKNIPEAFRIIDQSIITKQDLANSSSDTATIVLSDSEAAFQVEAMMNDLRLNPLERDNLTSQTPSIRRFNTPDAADPARRWPGTTHNADSSTIRFADTGTAAFDDLEHGDGEDYDVSDTGSAIVPYGSSAVAVVGIDDALAMAPLAKSQPAPIPTAHRQRRWNILVGIVLLASISAVGLLIATASGEGLIGDLTPRDTSDGEGGTAIVALAGNENNDPNDDVSSTSAGGDGTAGVVTTVRSAQPFVTATPSVRAAITATRGQPASAATIATSSPVPPTVTPVDTPIPSITPTRLIVMDGVAVDNIQQTPVALPDPAFAAVTLEYNASKLVMVNRGEGPVYLGSVMFVFDNGQIYRNNQLTDIELQPGQCLLMNSQLAPAEAVPDAWGCRNPARTAILGQQNLFWIASNRTDQSFDIVRDDLVYRQCSTVGRALNRFDATC